VQLRRDGAQRALALGWRFAFGDHFYATPWISVGYTFNAKDVTLAGSTYSPSRITVFPAVHLGYRFK